ncbi:MAG: deoxyguanosinetriphosphate triphosphohydrolase [Eubacterium sp.]|nr:deoxyguanosinetriphosphate triphosphohydrolase [Eubacterium sp.]
MNIRQEYERQEHILLSKYASFSDASKGREREEVESDLRTIYQRDRDRIVHCKSFRRLKHKTQVFLAPYGDHYRTRLTHTLEVSQIARTIAKAIRCNEELTEAIALAHDIGHTPFGHVGERTLSAITGRPFSHNEHGVRVVEKLENSGRGLNLTWEVRDGIRNHKTDLVPATLEGDIVRMSDKIAYISHDIDDGIRAGIIKESSLPKECTDILGNSTRERIDRMIHNIVNNSQESPRAKMSEDYWQALIKLRLYMFDILYTNMTVKKEETKAADIIKLLYDYYMEDKARLPQEYYYNIENGEDEITVICDYIAGMTDNYAVELFQNIYIPHSWSIY